MHRYRSIQCSNQVLYSSCVSGHLIGATAFSHSSTSRWKASVSMSAGRLIASSPVASLTYSNDQPFSSRQAPMAWVLSLFVPAQYSTTVVVGPPPPEEQLKSTRASRDRKSTRLNSSHVKISYAVFCLKQK